LFDEPINACSNVVFLLAAWAVWRLAVRSRAVSAGLCVLIGLSISVGIGSALWHTFATSWALLLDVVPILLFQLGFLWLYGREIGKLRPLLLIALLIGYVSATLWMKAYERWLNGGMMYLPSVVLTWTVGIHYLLVGHRERPILLVSAVVFCAALTCRSIDLLVCRQLPIGTHFLWHVLNGLVVYLAMRAIVLSSADDPSNHPKRQRRQISQAPSLAPST
jgi:hypothetical protein